MNTDVNDYIDLLWPELHQADPRQDAPAARAATVHYRTNGEVAHRVDVRHDVVSAPSADTVADHQAVCGCGWTGMPRPTAVAAWHDAKSHSAAER